MKKIASAALLMLAGGLVACTSAPTDKTVVYSEFFTDQPSGDILPEDVLEALNLNTEPQPPEFSMLDIGRSLSAGAVDIFDPWLPSLTVPAPERAEADPLASFIIHPHMLVRDQSVRVYKIPENPYMEWVAADAPLDLVTDIATSPNAPAAPEVESEPLDIMP